MGSRGPGPTATRLPGLGFFKPLCGRSASRVITPSQEPGSVLCIQGSDPRSLGGLGVREAQTKGLPILGPPRKRQVDLGPIPTPPLLLGRLHSSLVLLNVRPREPVPRGPCQAPGCYLVRLYPCCSEEKSRRGWQRAKRSGTHDQMSLISFTLTISEWKFSACTAKCTNCLGRAGRAQSTAGQA